jgi:hypothetical protein
MDVTTHIGPILDENTYVHSLRMQREPKVETIVDIIPSYSKVTVELEFKGELRVTALRGLIL